MTNRFETVFIMTPVLSDKKVKECTDKFRKLLKSNKAKVLHEEFWGLRKLAYPIQKKSHGFYHLIEFEAAGELISKLETEFKRDERIIRFLTVRMDKYAIEFSEGRRKSGKTSEVKKSEETEEAVEHEKQ
ncbi:MAG: 30S ribosomal protein S6 [Flavobacteriales bacterium]